MRLPGALDARFDATIFQYEKERRMQYVTSVERRGLKKSLKKCLLQKSHEDIVEILHVRFQSVSEAIVEHINAIDDLAVLQELFRKTVTVSSLDEFLAILDRQIVAA